MPLGSTVSASAFLPLASEVLLDQATLVSISAGLT
jgi:hypothetical protein